MRSEWKAAGGSVYGPNVETVSMPEERYFAFRAELESQIKQAMGKEVLAVLLNAYEALKKCRHIDEQHAKAENDAFSLILKLEEVVGE